MKIKKAIGFGRFFKNILCFDLLGSVSSAFISFFLSLQNGAKRKYRRCNVCAQDIQGSCFPQHWITNHYPLETGDKLKCEFCDLLGNSGSDYQRHLLSEERLLKLTARAQNRSKIRVETGINEFSQNVYDDISGSQTLIKNSLKLM